MWRTGTQWLGWYSETGSFCFADTASVWYADDDPQLPREAMRQKLFTLSRSQREDMWQRFKQTDDRRVAERLHAILLLDSGQNADAVSSILHIHPKTLKRWIKAFASGGEEALTSFKYVGGDGWMTNEQLPQFTSWLDADVRSTAEAVSWVEQQFALSYSDSGMRKLLKRLDYRYKQPAVLPAKADVEAQAAWVETYTAKKGP
jgi:transposase